MYEIIIQNEKYLIFWPNVINFLIYTLPHLINISSSSSQTEYKKMQSPPQFYLIQNILQSTDIAILKDLIGLKCLYSKQLTRMPREYLIKLLFDTCHQSLIIKIQREIIAGITFRSFDNLPFYQIAFVAVKQQQKFKGFGSLIMNKFKNICQYKEIQHIFTFADDGAIGFFQKHGFSKNITLPKESYQPYVKQYIGGKLMECKLDFERSIDFQNLIQSLEQSKQELLNRVKSLISLAPYMIEKSTAIIRKFTEKEFFLNELAEFIPGLKEVSSEKEDFSSEERKLTLNFLFYCQAFIEQIAAKTILLKDNIQDCMEKNKGQQNQFKRRKQLLYSYRCLIHQMQIQLLQGHFKYKDQFTKHLSQKINELLGPQEKLKGKEKQFFGKIKQLSYDFMKNQLSYESIDKKFKLHTHFKI